MQWEKDKKRVSKKDFCGVESRKEEEIQETLLSNNEKLRALSTRMFRMQEQERIRLSRELHDEVGQALTVIKLNLQMLYNEEKFLTSSALEIISDSIALLDTTLDNVRRQAFSLRPPILDDIGLYAAIENMAAGFSRRTRIQVDLKGELEQRLPPEYETALFRCAQEALTNVARHAGASQVEISLKKECSGIQMNIKDNGCGFKPDAIKTSVDHTGLIGMQERAKLLGGTFQINSGAGLGTELKFWVPLPDKVREAGEGNEVNPG